MYPRLIQADFEAALNLAAKIVFPKASMRGCLLHYSSAVFNKMKELGLVPFFQSHQEVRHILRRIMCLPLLPAHKITEQVDFLLINDIQQTKDPRAKELLSQLMTDYIINFWIRKIGPSRMSVWGCPDKTNNGCEQFHAQMHSQLKRSSKIFNFLAKLNDNLYADCQRKLEQLDEGHNVHSIKKKSDECQQ